MAVVLCLVVMAALLVSQASAGTGAWTTGGPEGGLTRAIAASPNIANDGTVFSAAQGRGVIMSTDRGATWDVSNSGMGNADVRSLAISPAYATDHTVFAGSLGGGVYRSRDGGQSWSGINNGLPTGLVWSIALSPQFPTDRTIFAATDDRGVYRSSNGGDTWISANTGLTLTSFLAIAVSPDFTNDHTILAGAQGGVFRSTDGGATWAWAGDGIMSANIRSLVFSPAFASDGTAFVGTERDAVFKTTDRGRTWAGTGVTCPDDISGMAISPNFANDHTLFVTNDTFGYSKSTDGGASWSAHLPFVYWYQFQLSNDGLSIAVSPNYANDGTVWAGTIGTGIFRTQNRAQSWQLLRTGYYAVRSDRVAASGSFDADHTVFALGLGGGVYASGDGGQTWTARNGPWEARLGFGEASAVATSPAFATDHTVFVARINKYNLVRSFDGGANWERADSGLTTWDISNLAVSPAYTSDGTVFAASQSQGIFRSTNQGGQWAAVNTGLGSLSVTNVAPSSAFATDHTVFASTNGGGVYKSTDGGSTWQAANSGLGGLNVRDIAVSPAYASDQTLFACTSLGIYRSLNGGASWTLSRTAYGLSAVAISPRYAQDTTVYTGGNDGVARSTTRGDTWSDISAMLGQPYVTDLSVGLDGNGHTLFASTRGGSVWQYTAGSGSQPPTSTPTGSPPPATTPTASATRTPTTLTSPTTTPTSLPPAGPYRINAGGPQYTDVFGRTWLADRAYTPGGFGYQWEGGQTYAVTAPISGTDDDTLYQTERFNIASYRFDLPNGTYRVELLFAEIWDNLPNNRIFDVTIQGATVLPTFCPFTAAGGRLTAVRYLFLTTVSNNQLIVGFTPKLGAAKISAIGVEPVDTATTPTTTATAAPSATATPTPSATATPTSTATPSASTATPTSTATASATTTATPTSTAAPPPATASPTLTATATSTGPLFDVGVNCGGGLYTGQDGATWRADQPYRPGGWGYVDGGIFTTSQPITGTVEDTLYQNERWGMSSYRFDLPNGVYRVQLKFAEIYAWAVNQRVFDVQIEGQTVLAGLDLFAQAGRFTASDRSFDVAVSDGRLDITFTPHISAAKLNAIRVTALPPP